MSLPPNLDSQIRQRFHLLAISAEQLIQKMINANADQRARDRGSNIAYLGSYHLEPEDFYSLQTEFILLVQLLSSETNVQLNELIADVRKLESTISDARKLKGFINGLQRVYDTGLLNRITYLIEAELVSDYLGQAERLLSEGQSGKYDHVPAAVLAGAVLEDGLRRLCQRHTPPIDILKSNGEPKTLNPLIDELKKAGLFNELKAKQLRAWADIRNSAAHGEFSNFNRADVEQMLVGIQTFLTDYL